MNYLLDTHALIFYAEGSPKLSPNAKSLIDAAAERGNVFVSPVSIWEIGIKHSKGKLTLPASTLEEFTQKEFEICGYNWLHIKAAHIFKISQLCQPSNHNDPFDRLLIAQAIYENMQFVSCDGNISAYSTDGLRLYW